MMARVAGRAFRASFVVAAVVCLSACTGMTNAGPSASTDVESSVPPQTVAPAPSLDPVPDDESSIAPRVTVSDSAGQLASVTATTEGDYDVLTFTFAGGTVPGYDIRYVDRVERASGDVVALQGSAAFSATLTNTSAGTDGALDDDVITNSTYDLPVIEQVVLVGNVGGTLTFGVGLSWQAPFTVEATEDALVVSFEHPSG